MNTRVRIVKQIIATAVASLFIVACVTAPPKHDDLDAVRSKLTQLQSDPQLATRAPQAIKEAELAVGAAGEPRKDAVLTAHLVLIADRKVDIARAQAQSALLVDQRKTLSAERETARLDARTHEADVARMDATAARADADSARVDTDAANTQADVARTEADIARSQADAARIATDAALLQAAELQKQIAELNAKATDRGLVVTLGDVLFETAGSELKGSATGNLNKLAAFLNKYPDRTVIIEGNADSVGDEAYNLGLSQRRADSVKSYLVSQGVASTRLAASGKGEDSPIASNDSATGRQQNRRVEVIISNT